MSFAGIQATVLQKNNEAFFCNPCGSYGKNMTIPCGSTAATTAPGTWWAVPVTDSYVQGFRFVAADSAPTFDSIQVIKVTNLQNGDYFWVIGTDSAYYSACAACCDASPTPTMVVTSQVSIPTTQSLCTEDGTNFDAFFAVPAIGSGRYVSAVSVDGAQLTPIQTYATGSTSLANLISYLNTNYASAGTWSNPGGNTVKLRATEKKVIGFIACSKTS